MDSHRPLLKIADISREGEVLGDVRAGAKEFFNHFRIARLLYNFANKIFVVKRHWSELDAAFFAYINKYSILPICGPFSPNVSPRHAALILVIAITINLRMA